MSSLFYFCSKNISILHFKMKCQSRAKKEDVVLKCTRESFVCLLLHCFDQCLNKNGHDKKISQLHSYRR